MTEKRALVVGVTGAVGAALAQQLADDGWAVCGLCRRPDTDTARALAARNIGVAAFDVTTGDPADLPDVDVVFLEIWDPTDPALIWPINYYGVGRIVERYAGQADVVNGCTINVYGDGPHPPDESAPCRPTSEYGRSRWAQERLIDYFCVRSRSKAAHVRYAHANTETRGIVRRMADLILAGSSLGPDPDARLQVIALEDFIRVTLGCLGHLDAPAACVNCCHPRVWTHRELADDIRARMGRGHVVFDRAVGGEENSAVADATRMLDWFGPPRVPLDTVIDRACRAAAGA